VDVPGHRHNKINASVAVKVDDTLGNGDLLSLAYSMRDVTPGNVEFFTAPVLGTGMEDAASVGTWTPSRATGWTYLHSDSLAANAAEFKSEALPDVPR
jgi:hypothetical protein